MEYGSHWQNKPNLYRDKKRYHQQALKIKKEIDRSEEVCIKHYCSRYKNPGGPPSWMCLEVVSMGTLSKLFQNLKKCDAKKAVVDYFGVADTRFLENWMFCFTLLRNIWAHHGRFWNRRLTAKPKLPYNSTEPFLSKEEIREIYPN